MRPRLHRLACALALALGGCPSGSPSAPPAATADAATAPAAATREPAAPPASPPAPTPRQEPEATPEPAGGEAPAPKPDAGAGAPEPAAEGAPALVAPERLEALHPVDRAPPLALPLAERCSTLPAPWDDEACAAALRIGAVAVRDDGAVAFLAADTDPSCAEGPPLRGVVAALPSLRVGVDKPFPAPDEDPEGAARAAWAWLVRLPGARFVAPTALVVARAEQVAGIRSHAPTARLGPPLAGWLLDAASGAEAATWRLVSPDRRKAYVLGEVPVARARDCPEEDREAGACGDATYPSVLDAALSADRRVLLVTASMGDGTHCGADVVTRHAWALPPGVPGAAPREAGP